MILIAAIFKSRAYPAVELFRNWHRFCCATGHMNTLAALEHYNSLCDELDLFMHEENSQLRSHGSDAGSFLDRKRGILEKLEGALQMLRMAGPVRTTEHAASCDVRKRVMAKILKLLLLSRESEQLLLKSSVCSAPRVEAPKATPARLANAYKTRKTPAKGTSQAEGSWVVW